tara:strand:- start:326 stop:526 length:201 start_codon:yes stop_codon:yes gene_type:complete
MSKLDVIFVHPNASKKIYQDLNKKYSAIETPLWAGLLANRARLDGYDTKIIDCEAENIDSQSAAKK